MGLTAAELQKYNALNAIATKSVPWWKTLIAWVIIFLLVGIPGLIILFVLGLIRAFV